MKSNFDHPRPKHFIDTQLSEDEMNHYNEESSSITITRYSQPVERGAKFYLQTPSGEEIVGLAENCSKLEDGYIKVTLKIID